MITRKVRCCSKGKKSAGCLLILLAALTFVLFLDLLPTGDAAKEYQALAEAAESKQASKNRDSYVATQKRIGVCKDLFFEDEGHERRYIKIVSECSDLIFKNEDRGAEMLERLRGVQFFMQDELFYFTDENKSIADSTAPMPMQSVRYVQAEEALCNFHSDKLDALQCVVSRYRLPGHRLPECFEEKNLLMRGNAEKASLRIVEGKVHFNAKQMKTHFYSPRSLF